MSPINVLLVVVVALQFGCVLSEKNDIPDLTSVPRTDFTCKGRMPGYYADMETACQVYHMCGPGTRKVSFLCPPGTRFHQRLLVCDHTRSVDCGDSDDFFDINERLSDPRPGVKLFDNFRSIRKGKKPRITGGTDGRRLDTPTQFSSRVGKVDDGFDDYDAGDDEKTTELLIEFVTDVPQETTVNTVPPRKPPQVLTPPKKGQRKFHNNRNRKTTQQPKVFIRSTADFANNIQAITKPTFGFTHRPLLDTIVDTLPQTTPAARTDRTTLSWRFNKDDVVSEVATTVKPKSSGMSLSQSGMRNFRKTSGFDLPFWILPPSVEPVNQALEEDDFTNTRSNFNSKDHLTMTFPEQHSFQVNPRCPHCHPDFLQDLDTCLPCVFIR